MTDLLVSHLSKTTVHDMHQSSAVYTHKNHMTTDLVTIANQTSSTWIELKIHSMPSLLTKKETVGLCGQDSCVTTAGLPEKEYSDNVMLSTTISPGGTTVFKFDYGTALPTNNRTELTVAIGSLIPP